MWHRLAPSKIEQLQMEFIHFPLTLLCLLLISSAIPSVLSPTDSLILAQFMILLLNYGNTMIHILMEGIRQAPNKLKTEHKETK